MIGLVIASHGGLAAELLTAAEMIIGPSEAVRTVSIYPDQDIEEVRTLLAGAVAEVKGEDGVVIMTDMFGGTPSNLGLGFLVPGEVEVITGVNLPMVIKCLNSQDGLPLAELTTMLKAYGQQNISLASDFLNRPGGLHGEN